MRKSIEDILEDILRMILDTVNEKFGPMLTAIEGSLTQFLLNAHEEVWVPGGCGKWRFAAEYRNSGKLLVRLALPPEAIAVDSSAAQVIAWADSASRKVVETFGSEAGALVEVLAVVDFQDKRPPQHIHTGQVTTKIGAETGG